MTVHSAPTDGVLRRQAVYILVEVPPSPICADFMSVCRTAMLAVCHDWPVVQLFRFETQKPNSVLFPDI
jgi:hypothetical protein